MNQHARVNATVFTSQVDSALQISGKTSFAVPAPPPLASAEKVRRFSDGEHFRQPNVTVSAHAAVQKQLQEAQTQAQAQALADMILKVHFCSSIRDLSTLLFRSSNDNTFLGGKKVDDWTRSNIFRITENNNMIYLYFTKGTRHNSPSFVTNKFCKTFLDPLR